MVVFSSASVLIEYSFNIESLIKTLTRNLELNVKLNKSSGDSELDKFMLELVSNMPKWKAEKKNGKYVTSNYVLPIQFSKKSEKVLSNKIVGEAFFQSGVDDYKEEKYEKAIFKLIQAISRNNMEAKYYFLMFGGGVRAPPSH